MQETRRQKLTIISGQKKAVLNGYFFGQSLHLHPCFVYTSNESSGKSALMGRLIGALAARCRDTYKNLVLAHLPLSQSRSSRSLLCLSGFIQASLSKIQGLFKDLKGFPAVFKD